MTHPSRSTDRLGLVIPSHAHVKITHPRHGCYGMTGTVVRIKHPRVWVALSDGRTVPAGHRSIEVIVPKGAVR